MLSDTICQRTEIAPLPSLALWMSLQHGCLHRQMNLQNQTQGFSLCCLSYKHQHSQQTNTSQRSLPASSAHSFGFLWEELYNHCLFIHPLTKSINMYWAPTVSKALCWMLGNTLPCVKHTVLLSWVCYGAVNCTCHCSQNTPEGKSHLKEILLTLTGSSGQEDQAPPSQETSTCLSVKLLDWEHTAGKTRVSSWVVLLPWAVNSLCHTQKP